MCDAKDMVGLDIAEGIA